MAGTTPSGAQHMILHPVCIVLLCPFHSLCSSSPLQEHWLTLIPCLRAAAHASSSLRADVWRAIIEYTGRLRYLKLVTVSKSLRDAHAATGFERETSLRNMCESINLCRWAREQGCPWDARLCAAAAAGGTWTR
jgi:hypothetical protein